MSNERKKIEKKPINTVVPKKREVEKPKEPKKQINKKPTQEENTSIPKFIKQNVSEPKNNLKFERISLDADIEERKKISDRVVKGELKWQFFAIDGNKSYHYYLVVKKN